MPVAATSVTRGSSNLSCGPLRRSGRVVALRRHRWFDNLSGLLIGRSTGPVPESPDSLSCTEALSTTLGDLRYPVLYDVDVGHQPPQFTLINDAIGHVQYQAGSGSVTQVAA